MQASSLVLTSYQDSLTRAMDVVANNVANSNTTGFKRQELLFETLINRPTPNVNDTILFGADRGTLRDTAPGTLVTTGNPLDVAIQGQGYFPVQTPNGTRYTRNGSFVLNAQGEIVTPAGEKLLGDGEQAIALPEGSDDIHIGSDGIVTVFNGSDKDAMQIGKIKIIKFANEQQLQPSGNNLYTTTQTPQPIDADSSIVQGVVEQSNVKTVNEITNMISILRSYQQVVHLLDLDHQRQSSAIDRLGKVTA
jgi:flagellar basal-body rod protein FlgF